MTWNNLYQASNEALSLSPTHMHTFFRALMSSCLRFISALVVWSLSFFSNTATGVCDGREGVRGEGGWKGGWKGGREGDRKGGREIERKGGRGERREGG